MIVIITDEDTASKSDDDVEDNGDVGTRDDKPRERSTK